jgi:hypothetical protein
MVLVVLVVLPATLTLTLLSLRPSRFARWITVLAIGACVIRVVWSLYDAGDPATFAAIALTPFLLLLVIAVVLLVASWPKAITRELAEAALRKGRQVFRELPDGRRAAAGAHGGEPRPSRILPSTMAPSTGPSPIPPRTVAPSTGPSAIPPSTTAPSTGPSPIPPRTVAPSTGPSPIPRRTVAPSTGLSQIPPSTPVRSVSSLLIALAVLAAISTTAGLASRPPSAHGSASA